MDEDDAIIFTIGIGFIIDVDVGCVAIVVIIGIDVGRCGIVVIIDVDGCCHAMFGG